MVGYLDMNIAYVCLGTVPFFSGFRSYIFGDSEAKLYPVQLFNKHREAISVVIISMCVETDKIPGCLDTQISTG